MLKVIRRGVFETNSSSTHSITMCSKEEYDKWGNGEYLFSDNGFITKEEAIEELKNDKWFNKNNVNFDFNNEEEIKKVLKECDYHTIEDYFEDEYLEVFEDEYITTNGEIVIAFGKYGYNG